jgi:hypothetical protein
MSWLLFIDESGHDHRNTPYEVRGGVAISDSELWPFIQDWRQLEDAAFGTQLSQYKKEVKGAILLNKDRFKWAGQGARIPDEYRQKHCRSFLTKGLEGKVPTRDEFTAYGQACLEMARGVFGLLTNHKSVLFAAAIPRDVSMPSTYQAEEFLRKDHVFLLERFFYFLEGEREQGLLVMDEAEKTKDRKFVQRLQNYFQRTETGRYRTQWIVPAPFFVASDMTYPVQAADLCIYCVNWGFRLPARGMDEPVRREIADEFGAILSRLQFRGQGHRNGQVYDTYGIRYVANPYGPRDAE